MMEIHFIDVGCGNMTLIKFPSGLKMIYDCNITSDNEKNIISYLDRILGSKIPIDIFVNSHRDADHMRGIKTLHASHQIQKIWDSGETGTSPDSPEYRAYMDVRRSVGYEEIKTGSSWTCGEATIKCLNSWSSDYSDPNDQSIVLKLGYKNNSILLSGDTSAKPWKEKILSAFPLSDIKSTFLLAPHHGSINYFEDSNNPSVPFLEHIKKINPDMTIISVGPNTYGFPEKKAINFYYDYSRGANNGDKVYMTQEKGTIILNFKDDGGWGLTSYK